MDEHRSPKHSTCRGVALDCINDNATDAGCTPPTHGHWTEYDAIPEWGVISVADLIDTYLTDGTASHYCEER